MEGRCPVLFYDNTESGIALILHTSFHTLTWQIFEARVAKLADALDSESSEGNFVQVQVLSRAQYVGKNM